MLPAIQNPKFTKKIVSRGLLKKDPLFVIDVGARGGFQKHWDHFLDQVYLLGFEPDKEECEFLIKNHSAINRKYVPLGLHSFSGEADFYVAENPSSSSCYPPNMDLLGQFEDGKKLYTKKVVRVPVSDLDSCLKKQEMQCVDFIKLDTEGSELDVLKGGVETLKNVIAITFEFEFLPLHMNQPLFSDLDAFLRHQGFSLFNMRSVRFGRKSLYEDTCDVEKGQIATGYALYFKNGYQDFTDEKALKAISLFELFDLPDCAIDLLLSLYDRGQFSQEDFEFYRDLLVPDVGKKSVTFDQYYRSINKKMQGRSQRWKRFFTPSFLKTSLLKRIRI